MSYSNIKELDNIIEHYKEDMEVAIKFQKCMEEIRGINYKIIKISEIFEQIFDEPEVEHTYIASIKIINGIEITMFRDINLDLNIMYNFNNKIVKINDFSYIFNTEDINIIDAILSNINSLHYNAFEYELINMRYNYYY
jgi:hypothetical protein